MRVPLALVDCNNFYAGCERVFGPRYVAVPWLCSPTTTAA